MVMEQVYEVYFNNVGYYTPLYLHVYMYGVYHRFKNMHLYMNMYCPYIHMFTWNQITLVLTGTKPFC